MVVFLLLVGSDKESKVDKAREKVRREHPEVFVTMKEYREGTGEGLNSYLVYEREILKPIYKSLDVEFLLD